jgi:N-acyl-D-aspartate/D-glutamate deacylase
MAGFDVVVRGGEVVDGSGEPSFRADVGVRDGRIVEVGKLADTGRLEVDAHGLVVTPGFIDGHTHLDAQVFWDQLGSSSCWHGVTTAIMGNCGFSLAPAREDERALVVRNLERAEDMSPAALAAGLPWTWESFPEYLDAVDAVPKAINYAAYVGHSALRTAVMGERAFEETSSDDDLEAMRRVLRAALEAGAIGFTTSLSPNHATSDDRPVASLLATWAELSELVHVVGQCGGIFELAMEHEWRSDDPGVRAASSERLFALAMASKTPITFGIVPQRPDGTDWREKLALIDRTVAAGGRMFAQAHSRGVTNVLSFKTKLPFDVIPEWQRVRQLPKDEQIALLRKPEVRAELVRAAHLGVYGKGKGGEPKKVPFEAIRLFDHPLPPFPTVTDVAAERGCDPVEVMIDLAVASDFDQLFFQPFSLYDQEAIREAMTHPHAMMTFSDSGAHVSQIADSSLQSYFLAHWIRDQQAMTLEDAVNRLTFGIARRWGILDRGLVRPGYLADLNVLDPQAVEPELPIVVDDYPAGSLRLLQKAKGFHATMVGGELTFLDGEHTGRLPGRLLRGPFVSS